MTRDQRLIVTAVATTVLAFLIGFGWQYTRARGLQQRLDRANVELTFERLESVLAAASFEAKRGNNENARRLASEFFAGIQNDMPRAPETQQAELRRIAAQRDIVITTASRNEPRTTLLLDEVYDSYRRAFGKQPISPRLPHATSVLPPVTPSRPAP